MNIVCIGCGKTPEQLAEYTEAARDLGVTPVEYVIKEEGTYNMFVRGKFYCTPCYIKAGMPIAGDNNAGH